MQTSTQQQTAQQFEAAKPNQCSTGACPLMSRRGLVLWLALIGIVAFVQWPMLKGFFYQTTGTAAPVSTIEWRSDYEAALAEATKTGKPLLVDFSASWCPPCITMKHDVWPDPQVSKAVTEGYVPVLIDVDDPKNAEVASRFAVRGIPAVFVVDTDGRIIRQAAFMSGSQAMKFLSAGT
jgi:thiol:disulfide interchange protein